MEFLVGAFATWLLEQLAEAGRKRLVALLAGDEYERALRRTADAAIQLTAEAFCPGDASRAEHLRSVVDQVFGEPASVDVMTGNVTLLEALRAGIEAKLAPLDDVSLTGTAQSSAELLGVSGTELAQQLAAYVVKEIINRGVRGGPLASLANQLSHNETQLQLRGIALAINEIGSSALASQRGFLECRGFTRRVGNGQQLLVVRPHFPFFGRQTALAQARRRLEPDAIVPVIGADRSGKTEFIAHLFGVDENVNEIIPRFPLPLSMLRVNLGDHFGQRRVLRGLAYALNIDSHEELLDFQEETIAADNQVRGSLLGELLPDRLYASSPIAIFENVSAALSDEKSRADLNAVLALDLFRDGAALVTGTEDANVTGNGRRMLTASIRIEPLSSGDVHSLLNFYLNDPDVVASATSQILAFPELLLPGLLKQGVASFIRQVDERTIKYGPEALINSILETFEGSVRDQLKPFGFTEVIHDGVPTPLLTLFVMAVLARMPISESMVHLAGLPIPPRGPAPGSGPFVEEIPEHQAGLRLSGFWLGGLRLALCSSLWAESRDTIVDGCRRVLHVLQETSEVATQDSATALEEALAWAEKSLPSEMGLRDVLSSYLIVETAGAVTFPFSEEESDALEVRLSTPAGAEPVASEAMAQLVLAARFGSDKGAFVDRLRNVAAIFSRHQKISMSQLRSLDIATFVGTSRYHCTGEVLPIRRELVPVVLRCSRAGADMGLQAWTVSWMLNTASVALRADNPLASVEALDVAEQQLASLPRPSAGPALGNWLWLRSRRASLGAQLADNPEDRRSNLKLAAADAALAVIAGGGGNTWVRRYFRAVRGVLEDIADDHERVREVDAAIEHVIGVYGELDTWPLHVRLQASSLVRVGAERTADVEVQADRARKALNLVEPAEDKIANMAKLGDVRGVLLLARSHRLLARCQQRLGLPPTVQWNAAIRFCKVAVDSAATGPAWQLLLQMTDEERANFSSDPADIITEPLEISKSLQREIRRCESWLAKLPVVGSLEGSVALWCVDRRWRSQGDISRVAQGEVRPAWHWEIMPSAEKAQALERAYRTRHRQLDRLETRFGPFAKLSIKRAFLEGQYQRLVALQTDHHPKNARVHAIFRDARRRWPDDLTIILQEGHFFRWIWQYPDAVEAFDRVIYRSNDGEQRRDAIVRQVETLLIAALHCTSIRLSDGAILSPRDLVARAKQLLPSLAGFHETSFEAALLRDRVLYEAGEKIDWSALGKSYELVVGDIGKYPETVMQNLDTLLQERQDIPNSLAELVRQEFTTVEALKHMGLLYLRRAERGDGDFLQHGLRAYATFAACSILERSWNDGESPVTAYNRGRAILTAAQQARTVNPFTGNPDGYYSWAHLAEARLQSAVARGVGLFYEAAKQKLAEVRVIISQAAREP